VLGIQIHRFHLLSWCFLKIKGIYFNSNKMGEGERINFINSYEVGVLFQGMDELMIAYQ
jgi:hypothetical protein